MEKHIELLLEYLRTKEKNSNAVLSWGEYMDMLSACAERNQAGIISISLLTTDEHR
jgi:hypothetical protein